MRSGVAADFFLNDVESSVGGMVVRDQDFERLIILRQG